MDPRVDTEKGNMTVGDVLCCGGVQCQRPVLCDKHVTFEGGVTIDDAETLQTEIGKLFVNMNPMDGFGISQDFYIDINNGDDANDGLTMGTPVQNFATVMELIPTVGTGVYTVHMADGTYGLAEGYSTSPGTGKALNGITDDIENKQPLFRSDGRISIDFIGNESNPSAVEISVPRPGDAEPFEFPVFRHSAPDVLVRFTGITFVGGTIGLQVSSGGKVQMEKCRFTGSEKAGITVDKGGILEINGSGATGENNNIVMKDLGTDAVGIIVSCGGLVECDMNGNVLVVTTSDVPMGPPNVVKGGIQLQGGKFKTISPLELVLKDFTDFGIECSVDCPSCIDLDGTIEIAAALGTTGSVGMDIEMESLALISSDPFEVSNCNQGLRIGGTFIQRSGDSTAFTYTNNATDVSVTSFAKVITETGGTGDILGVPREELVFIQADNIRMGSFFGSDVRYIPIEEEKQVLMNVVTLSHQALPESIIIYLNTGSPSGGFKTYYRLPKSAVKYSVVDGVGVLALSTLNNQHVIIQYSKLNTSDTFYNASIC